MNTQRKVKKTRKVKIGYIEEEEEERFSPSASSLSV
jgi:hypothetical protein